MKRKIILGLVVTVLVFAQSCKKDSLQVNNLNNPDFKKVYASGSDLQNLASSLFITYYKGMHSFSGVEMMLATSSDNVSCSWGNQAMRDMSWEPRIQAWNNSPSYSYNSTTKYFFDKMYAVINTASNILKAIDSGVKIGVDGADNARTIAFCKFAQGIAYSQLGLVFDRAFIVDEKTKIDEATVDAAVSYKEIAIAAKGYLDVAISKSTGFTIPKGWLGSDHDVSAAEFKQICSTYAARNLSYSPRNKTELAAVNWATVKAYADAGITANFSVVNDGYTNFYAEAGDYLVYSGWGVTDMYTVNMMDSAQPQHWDDNASFPYPPKSTNPQDKRLLSDYEYVPSNWLQAARGFYHFSSYRNKRYDQLYINAEGPKPEVMKAENDMLKAEARVYTSDLIGAKLIIDGSTRTTRGQLPAVLLLTAAEVDAIHQERFVEMYTTGTGLQFFEMRKLNLLQKGTPLHLPLPAKTLETFGLPLPFYTYGTVAKADGINTSNAGWR